MKAVMVNEKNGYYKILPDAEVQIWENIYSEVAEITEIEELTGWNLYRYVIKFKTFENDNLIYFVEDDPRN